MNKKIRSNFIICFFTKTVIEQQRATSKSVYYDYISYEFDSSLGFYNVQDFNNLWIPLYWSNLARSENFQTVKVIHT